MMGKEDFVKSFIAADDETKKSVESLLNRSPIDAGKMAEYLNSITLDIDEISQLLYVTTTGLIELFDKPGGQIDISLNAILEKLYGLNKTISNDIKTLYILK